MLFDDVGAGPTPAGLCGADVLGASLCQPLFHFRPNIHNMV